MMTSGRRSAVSCGQAAPMACPTRSIARVPLMRSGTFAHLEREQPDTISRLRTIGWTATRPGLPFVTSIRSPERLVRRLRRAIGAAIADRRAAWDALFWKVSRRCGYAATTSSRRWRDDRSRLRPPGLKSVVNPPVRGDRSRVSEDPNDWWSLPPAVFVLLPGCHVGEQGLLHLPLLGRTFIAVIGYDDPIIPP